MKLKQTMLVSITVVTFFLLEFLLKMQFNMNISNIRVLQRAINGSNTSEIMLYVLLRVISITICIIILLYILDLKRVSITKVFLKVLLIKGSIFLINIIIEKIYAPSLIIFLMECISYILYYTFLVYVIFENRLFWNELWKRINIYITI